MLRYNKTGPRGLGPNTGRGLGRCNEGNVNYSNMIGREIYTLIDKYKKENKDITTIEIVGALDGLKFYLLARDYEESKKEYANDVIEKLGSGFKELMKDLENDNR